MNKCEEYFDDDNNNNDNEYILIVADGNYTVYLEAESKEEAIEEAREHILDGDWGQTEEGFEPCTIIGYLHCGNELEMVEVYIDSAE